MALALRPLTPADLPDLHRLEAEAYEPALHESDEAFLRLMALFPEGAIGVSDSRGLCAYAFAVPLPAGTVLHLQRPLEALAPAADMFYVHDVAVAGRCRGQGLGRRLATRLLEIARARGFRTSELVSVQGSASFWERFGFTAVEHLEYVPGAAGTRMRAALDSPE
jgi:ribosomal protein S18 acetylase RimI-like enzyme